MGKPKKKKGRKSVPTNQRPKQTIALLVFLGLSVFLELCRWLFYVTQNIVYDSSLGLSPEYFSIYRNSLLVAFLVELGLWLLLFFRTKIGYWITAVFYAFLTISNLFFGDLIPALISALCLYFLFCKSSRAYFGIGELKKDKKGKSGPAS